MTLIRSKTFGKIWSILEGYRVADSCGMWSHSTLSQAATPPSSFHQDPNTCLQILLSNICIDVFIEPIPLSFRSYV